MRLSILYTMIVMLLSCTFSALGNFVTPYTQQYFVKDGLSSNLVEQVAIDNSGFIWIATSRGLNKFDGVNFVYYKHDHNDEYSLNEDYVRCIYIEEDDNIWVGTKGGGLNYLDRKTGKFAHFTHDSDDPNSISNNEIIDIFRDSKSRLWIGTEKGLNLFDEKNQKFIRFLPNENDPYSIPNKAVLKIFEDNENNIWIGTWNGGLSFVEERLNQYPSFTFHTARHNPIDPSTIGSDNCRDITSDSNGVMWVGLFNSGASIVMPGIPYEKGKADEFVRSLKFVNYKSLYASNVTGLVNHNVKNIVFTKDNEVLFGTTSGLSVLDYSCIDLSKSWAELNSEKEELVFINNPHSKEKENIYKGSVIRSILQSENGNIWFSSNNGLIKASIADSKFQTYLDDITYLGEYYEVSSIEHSKFGYYLLVTNQGLLKVDPVSGIIEGIEGVIPEMEKSDEYITCLHEDGNKNLWVGTLNGLYRKDHNTKAFYKYSDTLDEQLFFDEQKINKIFEDKLGHIWMCTESGVGELIPQSNTFTVHSSTHNDPYGLGMKGVTDVVEDEEGRIWFSHLGLGLVKFERVNGRNTLEKVSLSQEDYPNSLARDFVRAIDYHDGILWLGAEQGLFSYDIENKKLTNYDFPEVKDLIFEKILSLGVDNANGVWISLDSEQSQLICFDNKNGKISTYNNKNGLPIDKFLSHSFHKDKDGKLSFGSQSGFTSFYGESIIKQINVPPVTLTSLSVISQSKESENNTVNDQTALHSDGLNQLETVNLSHKVNQFTIGFGVLDFRYVNNFEYAYQLEGLHDKWMHIGAKNEVSFTGLAPGKYVFKVKAKNQDGYWSTQATSINLVIELPWYQSWLAYLGFAILFLLFVYAFFVRKARNDLKERLQLEMLVEDRTSALRSITLKEKQARIGAELMKDEANNAQQRAESANLAKSQFLANMSHEIRTPMNGILGMLQLLNNTELNTEQSDYVRTSTESALGLIRIINDILDFSKVESDMVEMESEKIDIHAIIENVIDLNAANCQEKHIVLSYLIEPMVPRIIIGDEVRVRQILTNLVSNAIKFTSKGEVSLIVSVDPSAAGSDNNNTTDLKFVVKDSGIGISKEKVGQLFKAFSQVDASITRKFGGTGLGLVISRKLARLMNGDVSLKSKQGVGTEVTFSLNCEFDSATIKEAKMYFQDKSAAIIEKSVVSGKSLINMLESLGFSSFSIDRKVTSEFLEELIENPVDVLFIDSSYFTPSTEILLNKLKEKTNTKIVLNVPKLFPSLSTQSIDITTAKPFKKSNVHCSLNALFIDNGSNPKGHSKMANQGECSANKVSATDVFNDEFALTSPLKILVAEDHKINQMLIKKVLNKLGYTPVIVGDGQLAIDASLKDNYDVIFMDIQMPVLDGIGSTKLILENWSQHNEPYIIAMTANAMKGDREKYLSCGMHDYISKPFLINKLQEMLIKYSEKKYNSSKKANNNESQGS